MTTECKIVRECSACSKRIAHYSLVSGNTSGATYWTDGKREALMLPDQPWMVVCPHCHESIWLDEQRKLGEFELGEPGYDELKDADCVVPSVDDYFAALEGGVITPEKERYVRLKAWWAGNDPRRTSADEIPVSPREATNLRAFAEILNPSDDGDRIMKAEVMRELGCFDDAQTLLAGSFDEALARAVGIISSLVERGDRYVREMNFE